MELKKNCTGLVNECFFLLLILSDWSFANGMGKMPYSSGEVIKGEGSWPLCSCSSQSSYDARDYVVCEVKLYGSCSTYCYLSNRLASYFAYSSLLVLKLHLILLFWLSAFIFMNLSFPKLINHGSLRLQTLMQPYILS